MAVIDTPVLIVGGGPVGLGLAIELGQRGIACTVLERHHRPQPIPKGQNLTQRTLEHFHFWGAEPALRAARTMPASYGIGGLTAYGQLLGEHHYDWLQRELVRPYYFQANERLPQYATETVLRARVAEIPAIRLQLGWTVEGLEMPPGDDATAPVIVQARPTTPPGAAGNEAEAAPGTRWQARYVVGCDGARSVVREAAGIPLDLIVPGHDRLMVLLVFRSAELHRRLEQAYPGKSYFNVLQPELQGYWKFFGRVDLDGPTWFFHAPVPPGTTRDNFDFAAYVAEAAGTPLPDFELQHLGFWDLRFAQARCYDNLGGHPGADADAAATSGPRQPRVFLAGDAAHSHPPYGGYGVNTGFEDARNLGWKLAACLQGWGNPATLLASYDLERRPVFASTARDFIARAIETDRDFLARHDPARDRAAFDAAWTARAQGAVGEVHSYEPHYEGSPLTLGDLQSPSAGLSTGTCSAIGRHSFAARPGHHLAPAALADGRNVYEALGPGYSLIVTTTPERPLSAIAPAWTQQAQALGMPLTLIEAPAGCEAAQRYDAALVMVRPDQFVAWVDRSDPAALPLPIVQAIEAFDNGVPLVRDQPELPQG